MYTAQKCSFPVSDGSERDGYIITHSERDADELIWVNRYLHIVALRSSQTAKQYAYRLANFLNYLEGAGKTYGEADEDDITQYLRMFQYDRESVITLQQKISVNAIKSHYAPIRGLYIYLYESKQPVAVDIRIITKRRGKNNYLAGIVSSVMEKPDLLINEAYESGADPRPYIKQYTEKQKRALIDALQTKRDKAICSITFDGFRIDEIISSRLGDYDSVMGILTPYRSKRKADGSELRSAPLSERSMRLLEDYLLTERSIVEIELLNAGIQISDQIFINLRHGPYYGKPIQYHNAWGRLKDAAEKTGMDPARVRYHNGRSTRVNEFITDWARSPELYTEQDLLDLTGWKSLSSATPYIERNSIDRSLILSRKLRQADKERMRNQYGESN